VDIDESELRDAPVPVRLPSWAPWLSGAVGLVGLVVVVLVVR
jgi:hypothetical protein